MRDTVRRKLRHKSQQTKNRYAALDFEPRQRSDPEVDEFSSTSNNNITDHLEVRMGRGVHTNQANVTRHAPSYSSDATAVGVGSGPAPEMANACLVGFREELLLDGPSARGARAGLNITLVPGAIPGSINIMAANGARLGIYEGEHKRLLTRCMRKKYVYRGVIESVRAGNIDGQVYADCSIQGLGLV